MKAIVQDAYGPPEVLELRDVDPPKVGDDDVLVRVHAAGVDPGVWIVTAGIPYAVRLGFGLRAPRNRVRGRDFAGRVEAVGANVTRFKPGDEVLGVCEGSYAEYACARQHKVVPKPANLTFEQAAVLPVSGLTALQSVRDAGRVRAGQRVLVIGAAGGVGTFAVQVAKALGAHVTGVCSTSKVDLVGSIGADEVIDYTSDDLTDRGSRYDVIIDTAGNRPLSRLRRLLSPRGTLVLVGAHVDRPVFLGLGRVFRALLLNPFVRHRMTGFISRETNQGLVDLTELVEAGKIMPVLDRTYSLADAPEAIGYVHNGHTSGKSVIIV